jgi:hypothetical protein
MVQAYEPEDARSVLEQLLYSYHAMPQELQDKINE